MSNYVHAPDGYLIPGSLCEQDGDTTILRDDVDCPDCLDMIEYCNWDDLTRTTNELRSGRST